MPVSNADIADMLDEIGQDQVLLADRAYDSDALRQALASRGAWACVKPMPRRVNIPAFSAFLYRYRNLVERFFGHFQQRFFTLDADTVNKNVRRAEFSNHLSNRRVDGRNRANVRQDTQGVVAVGPDPISQFFGFFPAAVKDQQPVDSVVDQVAATQLDHLAGPDQHDALFFEVAEDLAGEHHGGVGHRYRVFADAGRGADRLRRSKGVLEQAVEDLAQAARVVSLLPGVLELPEDLCLTEHQRVETAGDAHQVPRGFLAFVRVDVLAQLAVRNPVAAVDPVDHPFLAVAVGQAVNLSPVAGAEDQHLLHAGKGAQLVDAVGVLRLRDGDLLPDFDGGGVVADSDREKRHGTIVMGCAQILSAIGLIFKSKSHRIGLAGGLHGDWFRAGKRVSLPPMTDIEQRHEKMTARLAIAIVALAAVLGGCAGSGAPREVDAGVESPAADPAGPLSEDAVYGVLAGEYLGAEGDLTAAADEYLEAALASSDPEIARRATQVAFAAESWQQAVMAADRWALLAPDSVPAHESAATAMLQVGDYMGAEYQLERILELLDDSGDAWLLVSRILAQFGEPAPAAEVMGQLVTARPASDPADVYFARSKLALQGRRLQDAFEFARRTVELYPDRLDYLTWAGRVALNLKLTPTAIEYVRRAWRLEPDNQDVAMAYADLLARDGLFETARAVMQGLPSAPDVMLSRILFELAANNRLEAERLFDEFATADFADPDAQAYFLGQAAEALGWPDRAIDSYAGVVAGEHRFSAALRRAELLGREGDVEAARAALATVRDSGDPQAVEQSSIMVIRTGVGRMIDSSFDH